MTNTPDTSPEAVEFVARKLETGPWYPASTLLRALSAELQAERGYKLDYRAAYKETVDQLRAAEAERDDQKKARLEAVRSWVDAEARAEVVEAKFEQAKALYLETLDRVVDAENELATLKAELAEARRLGATMSRFISGDSTERGVHAAHEFRAFLARSISGNVVTNQKETDT